MSDWVEIDIRPAVIKAQQVRLSVTKSGHARLSISRGALSAAKMTGVSWVGLARMGDRFRILVKTSGTGERLSVNGTAAMFSAAGRVLRDAGFKPGVVDATASEGLIEFDASPLKEVARG